MPRVASTWRTCPPEGTGWWPGRLTGAASTPRPWSRRKAPPRLMSPSASHDAGATMSAALSAWEEALWGAIGEVEPKALRAAILERSRRYTSDRARLASPLPAREEARDRAARALFFGLADAAKIAVPLAE